MEKNHIFLIGYMGSGKTTVGKILSRLTGFGFVDMDAEIERIEEASIRNIFMKYGEHEFRNKESEFLDKLCQVSSAIDIMTGEKNVEQKVLEKESKYAGFSSIPKSIISCGGGIILDDLNSNLLKDQCTIFLSGEPALLFERVKKDTNRPLAYMENASEEERLAKFQDLYGKREHLYQDAATYTININGKTPEDIAAEILALIERN